MSTSVALPKGWAHVEPQAKSIDELCGQLFNLGTLAWFYRGESQWYPNRQASLGRYLNSAAPTPLDAECNELARFRYFGNAHLTEAERDYVRDGVTGWLTLMQHHGGPTRLLDWTMSPWVAAYAAAKDDRDRAGFVWGFNPARMEKADEWSQMQSKIDQAKTFEDYAAALTSTSCEMVLSFLTNDATPRMVAQQGVFTFGHPARVDHCEIIGKHIAPGHAHVLVIPNQLKQLLMQRLQAMNVTAASLFPSLDGAGRAVYETMKVGLGTSYLINPRNR